MDPKQNRIQNENKKFYIYLYRGYRGNRLITMQYYKQVYIHQSIMKIQSKKLHKNRLKNRIFTREKKRKNRVTEGKYIKHKKFGIEEYFYIE